VIHVRTDEPDYADIEDIEDNWKYSGVYGHVSKPIADHIPPPLGKEVVTTMCVDAILCHDLITGHAATTILHLANSTQIDYCSCQATIETAMYGSKFVAVQDATDQVIDHCNTLHYLVSLSSPRMLGDNQSVVTSATIPHSRLNNCHNALSYHHVHEVITAKILGFFHIDGKKNPADVLSKHEGFLEIWPPIKTLLFWHGDTTVCIDTVMTKPTKIQQD